MNHSHSLLFNELAGSEIGLLCLDHELRVLWFTLAAQNMFSLSGSARGRLLSDISGEMVTDDLIDDAKIVVNTRLPLQRNFIMQNGRSFLRRIVPYTEEKNFSCGIVILFIDIAKNKHTENMDIHAYRQIAKYLERHMHERTAELQTLVMRLTLAEEYERYNLAHEIHDDLGEVLAVTRLTLLACEEEYPSRTFKQHAAELNSLLTRACRSVHAMIFQLCPPLLHEMGLVPALEWLAEELHRASDLKVLVQNDGMGMPLDLPVATLVFRALREILVNVAMLAQVDRVVLSVRRLDDRVKVILADTGNGFDYRTALKQPGRLGLSSIEERLNYINGGIEVEDMPGNNTRLILFAPLTSVSASLARGSRK